MNPAPKAVLHWLSVLCVMIVLIAVVGAITRLTGSGLSIVEWQPIMGAIPPLNEQDWLDAFQKYQQYPQYKLLNQGMTLGEFKFIFFWEYLHRLLGRAVGTVFLLPFLYFLFTRKINSKLGIKLSFAFVLGGLQGLLGWIMVKSGLADAPQVSHFRLAAHLSLALFLLSYLYWIRLDLIRKPVQGDAPWLRKPVLLFTAVVVLQIVYGAFVAGLKAGFAFNTFPLMMGTLVPPGAFDLVPAWINLFENPAAVQFIHRCLGWIILVFSLYLFARAHAQRIPRILLGLTVLQFLLGVSTLVLVIPISLAALHQLGGCLLLLACVWANHRLNSGHHA